MTTRRPTPQDIAARRLGNPLGYRGYEWLICPVALAAELRRMERERRKQQQRRLL